MPQLTIIDPVSNPLVGSTTLSGAIDNKQLQVTLASATGVVTPSLATGQAGSFLFVNGEVMQVTGAGTGTATYRVKRGIMGAPAQAHLSGAIVWIGNPATTSNDPSRPFSGALFAMPNGSPAPAMGPVPLSGTNSSAVPVAGTIYFSMVDVEFARPATGIVLLLGSVTGTDKIIVALYDFDGNLIANSATAGTTTGTASLLQSLPFVTPVQLRGQTSYFIAVQSNGTTDTFQKYITGQVPTNYQAGSITGTFGTIPATLALPGTFTTAKGPIGGIY